MAFVWIEPTHTHAGTRVGPTFKVSNVPRRHNKGFFIEPLKKVHGAWPFSVYHSRHTLHMLVVRYNFNIDNFFK